MYLPGRFLMFFFQNEFLRFASLSLTYFCAWSPISPTSERINVTTVRGQCLEAKTDHKKTRRITPRGRANCGRLSVPERGLFTMYKNYTARSDVVSTVVLVVSWSRNTVGHDREAQRRRSRRRRHYSAIVIGGVGQFSSSDFTVPFTPGPGTRIISQTREHTWIFSEPPWARKNDG